MEDDVQLRLNKDRQELFDYNKPDFIQPSIERPIKKTSIFTTHL